MPAAGSGSPTLNGMAKKNLAFDPHTFLATIGEGRNLLAVPKSQSIYAQGDQADAVFSLQ
jgi:hypothetical protein